MTDGLWSKRGALTDRRARLGEAMTGIMARDPSRPIIFRHGDLVEGIVAVVALLLMVWIGVPTVLAIVLAVATFVGVALLRPPGKRRDEPVEHADANEAVREAPVDVAGPPNPGDAAMLNHQVVAKRYGLTRRELEIYELLVQRLPNKEIAERLCIAEKTAEHHTHSILGKLGLKSRREIPAFAARHRLPPPSNPPNADG